MRIETEGRETLLSRESLNRETVTQMMYDRETVDTVKVEEMMELLPVENIGFAKINRISKPGKGYDRLMKVTLRDQEIRKDVIRRARQLRDLTIAKERRGKF